MSTEAYQASLDHGTHSAGFFNPDNLQARKLREQIAMETLDESLDYLLNEGGSVAIFDATNSTIERRRKIIARVQERGRSNLQVLFLESQCFDEALLQSNMLLKMSNPDYRDQDPVKALEDFRRRVAMYQKKYTPVGNIEERLGVSYCQMIDVGRKFITHNIKSFLATQVVGYLQHFNLAGRQVWLTRHGESNDNLSGKVSHDPGLSPHGVKYAAALSRFIDQERDTWNRQQKRLEEAGDSLRLSADKSPKRFHLWTSMTQRSIQTAKFFDSARYRIEHMRMLDDLSAGILSGLSDAEVKQRASDTQLNHTSTGYPGTRCEGYSDVTKRLRSIILELERVTGHVLFIGGSAVIRVLLAYCRGMQSYVSANVDIPLGTVYLLEPKPYGADYKEFDYNPETDSFHQKRDREG
ncbi:hypothetical protein VE01_10448 [Pseudogymnoascus verrucosus]|uniref:6-phosphofructo-2-kinase domain-containing protein n=1 Tax=Pseudogymnoascus verrucosus TaxID=342668 RepID=A0A1B8G6S3_9PEZI|nr:uncharacterized protein VE01_10448 [Pseudogymnoascus verrucosus]OBT91539.1 hypothetical protein VE01_10448 [Pseudogymnoascus verrucosus]